jgi:major membrane immunogen (membrane-anchored lipoprotein)
MKKILALLALLAVCCSLFTACGGENKPAGLADGTYTVDFKTDGSMFHVNETCNGKGTLTVKDGQMTVHITMPSKNIVNLFSGKAEDAQKDGAVLIQPTLDSVTYPDGLTEEVHGFDLPVPALDQEFDCAIVGTKGKWYDHRVIVSNPEPVENPAG